MQGHLILAAWITRRDETGQPHPAQLPYFPLFLPIPTLSSALSHDIDLPMSKTLQSLYEYNIQRCSLLYRNREGRGGWLRHTELQQAPAVGRAQGERTLALGRGPRAVAGEVGIPSECHVLRLN
uniref:Uncharacterized protein n=1 Tax=Myotis myotis TaxID=51298 RepID=A0A7J7T6P5_MYOMY|nr:hypothetical protein mMyoMyo1_009256 [Myotis myotis]